MHITTYFSQAILKFLVSLELLQESMVNHATLKAEYISIAEILRYTDPQIDQVRSVSSLSTTRR